LANSTGQGGKDTVNMFKGGRKRNFEEVLPGSLCPQATDYDSNAVVRAGDGLTFSIRGLPEENTGAKALIREVPEQLAMARAHLRLIYTPAWIISIIRPSANCARQDPRKGNVDATSPAFPPLAYKLAANSRPSARHK